MDDKRQWFIHARMLRKAGMSISHAAHFNLTNANNIALAAQQRLPRMPGWGDPGTETFEPKPVAQVGNNSLFVCHSPLTPSLPTQIAAFLTDVMAKPRGAGKPCLHGSDATAIIPKGNGKAWVPDKQRSKAASKSGSRRGAVTLLTDTPSTCRVY